MIRAKPILLIGIIALSLGLGCEDDGGPPGTLRFGQVGEVRVALEVPLLFSTEPGELRQVLTWNSSGAWQLTESISYRGLPGDENRRREQDDPAEYGFLIAQLNEAPGLKLVDTVDPSLTPQCPLGGTRVFVTIQDDVQGRATTWVRCSEGSLATLKTAEAGPDQYAVRVVQAAILVRDFTEGSRFVSAYSGSVPFGTLDRGEDSGARLEGPERFLSIQEGDASTPEGWVDFWRAHTEDPDATPPAVDWAQEMVLVAAVGRRGEAGDSVEIRRVLQTGEGTVVTLFERIPGDFCSPGARDHYPVHIAVAPRTLPPIEFSPPDTVRVPCGF